MANSVNLDAWLPMPEVIAATGMSQRTIYRMVTEGRLKQAARPIPGRRPLPVFDPVGVAELAQSTLKARPQVLPPMAESTAERIPPMEFWAALIEAVKQGPRQLPPAAETAETALPTLAELRQKVLVTRDEAKRLGFSGAILADAVRTGKLAKLPGDRFRLKDLEAL